MKVYLLVRLIGWACEEVVVEVKESHVGEFLEKGLANSKKKNHGCAAKYVLHTVNTYPSPEVFLRSMRKWGGCFAEVFFIKCPHHT